MPKNKVSLIQGDVCDEELVDQLLNEYHPSSIIHSAAESHVDRSIDDPQTFLKIILKER